MFDVLIKLKWFFKEHWKRYSFAIILLIVASIIEVLPPYILGLGIDEITTNTMTNQSLTYYVTVLLVIIFSSYAMNFIWQYQLFGGAITLEKVLRRRLMHQFLKMTPTFYERNRTGDLMARATNDLNAVSLTAGFGVMTLIDSTLYFGAIIFAMGFFISWKLTAVAMIPIPIIAILMQLIGKLVHERYIAAQSSFGQLNDSVLESVAGVRVVRAYVQEKKDEDRFRSMSEEVFQKNIHVAKINALFGPITKLGTGLTYIITLGYGAFLVSTGELTVGQIVSFTIYLGLATWPIIAIGELINVMQQGNASLDRVQETLSYEQDVKDPQQPDQIEEVSSIGFNEFS
ncbi:multidrug ABC transporter permease/ATP-binding protein, partial [Butyricicoccus sp. 1XD8-22]